jgi:hypothetical protein
MPKDYRWPCHALDRVRGVWGALLLGCSPTYLSVRTFACVPHSVARIHACVGARACACAACSPELGRGLCPFRLRRLPRTGRPRACPPRLPARLPPILPASPEGGGASCLPRRLIDFRLRSPVTRFCVGHFTGSLALTYAPWQFVFVPPSFAVSAELLCDDRRSPVRPPQTPEARRPPGQRRRRGRETVTRSGGPAARRELPNRWPRALRRASPPISAQSPPRVVVGPRRGGPAPGSSWSGPSVAGLLFSCCMQGGAPCMRRGRHARTEDAMQHCRRSWRTPDVGGTPRKPMDRRNHDGTGTLAVTAPRPHQHPSSPAPAPSSSRTNTAPDAGGDARRARQDN